MSRPRPKIVHTDAVFQAGSKSFAHRTDANGVTRDIESWELLELMLNDVVQIRKLTGSILGIFSCLLSQEES
jgi:hypothetical protein